MNIDAASNGRDAAEESKRATRSARPVAVVPNASARSACALAGAFARVLDQARRREPPQARGSTTPRHAAPASAACEGTASRHLDGASSAADSAQALPAWAGLGLAPTTGAAPAPGGGVDAAAVLAAARLRERRHDALLRPAPPPTDDSAATTTIEIDGMRLTLRCSDGAWRVHCDGDAASVALLCAAAARLEQRFLGHALGRLEVQAGAGARVDAA